MATKDDGTLRTFETGATRDSSKGKVEYAGALSPLVVKRFGSYMHEKRRQKDGSLRASDNWKLGIPEDAYLESLLRHVLDVWLHRDLFSKETQETYEDALCACLFNIQGLLHERLQRAYDLEDLPF